MKKTVLMLFLMGLPFFTWAQLSKKVLPRNINIPGKEQMAPSISGDGRSMIFLTDYTKSGELALRYAQMTGPGEWGTPEEIPVINLNRQYHFLIGFDLSYDGKTIFFTSRMPYGIGNYDIWYTTNTNGKWSPPKNLGKPVNSKTNDLSPSLSPDGRYLYYMRCDRVSGKKVEGCELMVVERRNAEYWNDPVVLPSEINSGQAAFPTILADGHSLIYTSSSSWAASKHQFFITRKENGSWTSPQAVEGLSQENTIPFISNSMQGDIIYMSILRSRGLDICMAKLQEVNQPDNVLLLHGKITDKRTGGPLDAYFQVYNSHNGELFNFARSDEKGNYFMPLPSDQGYNVAVNVTGNDYTYYATSLRTDTLDNFLIHSLDVQLEPLQPGVSMPLPAIYFDTTGQLDKKSLLGLQRLFKLLRDNPHLLVEISGHCKKKLANTVLKDSLYRTTTLDSAFYTGRVLFEADSLNYMPSDTLINPINPIDPTEEKAIAVREFLVNKGISPDRITAKGYGDTKYDSLDPTTLSQYPNEWLELKVTGFR